MIRALTLTAFVAFLQLMAYAKEPVETSVCAIATHPSTFHNKIVRLHAAAFSGMEAAILMDGRNEKWNTQCGRINLNFDSVEHDTTTDQFLKLFGTGNTFPQCDREKELNEGMAHILDSRAPAPKPCFDTLCIHCPRYNIATTFTGKLRYSDREPGHVRFGHLGMFTLQLDVRSVSNLDVVDTQLAEKP